VHDTNIVALAVESDGPIFAGTSCMNSGFGGNVLRSTDNGKTWTSVLEVHSQEGIYSLVCAGSGHVLLSTLGVYGSTDKGTTWNPANAGLPQTPILALARSRSTLFAGAQNNGIWRIPLSEATSVGEQASPRAPHYVLSQNYPNPFNSSTTIRYELPRPSEVRLSVYDMLGREVSTIVNERRNAGVYEVKFEAAGLASGVYSYRLTAGGTVTTKRFFLLK
jgi:hypothetical protein